MKSVLKFLPAATLAAGLALTAVPAVAQQPAQKAPAAPATITCSASTRQPRPSASVWRSIIEAR